MIRTIITPSTQTVFFEVPKDYIGKELEVIAFAKNEGLLSREAVEKKVSFSALSIDTKGFRFNRDQAHER